MQIFCLIYMMRKVSQHKNSHFNVLVSHCWFSCSLQYQISISNTYLSWMTAYIISLSDCFFSGSSISVLLYSSCFASWNCSRICSFMNHLVRCWVSVDVLIRAQIFSWFVIESFSIYLISANLKQWTIIWITVSCAWSYWHMSNS